MDQQEQIVPWWIKRLKAFIVQYGTLLNSTRLFRDCLDEGYFSELTQHPESTGKSNYLNGAMTPLLEDLENFEYEQAFGSFLKAVELKTRSLTKVKDLKEKMVLSGIGPSPTVQNTSIYLSSVLIDLIYQSSIYSSRIEDDDYEIGKVVGKYVPPILSWAVLRGNSVLGLEKNDMEYLIVIIKHDLLHSFKVVFTRTQTELQKLTFRDLRRELPEELKGYMFYDHAGKTIVKNPDDLVWTVETSRTVEYHLTAL